MSETRVVKASDAGEPSVARMARHLVAFEAEFAIEPPAIVVLADASDVSLAAALVATKMLIEVEATAAATDATTLNGRLIAQLASPVGTGSYTEAA